MKGLIVKSCALIAAVAGIVSPAFADTPRVMIGTNGSGTMGDGVTGSAANGNFQKAIAWTAQDGGTVITPWQIGSNSCVYVIQSAKKLSANSSFPDVPVELHNTEDVIYTDARTFTFPQMTVKSGAKEIMINAEGTLTLKGGYTVPSGVTFPLAANGAGNNADTPRDVTLNATLIGQSDSIVQYSFGLAGTPAVNPVPSTLTISGDAASFKGKYVVADAPTKNKNNTDYVGQAHLFFNCATAFGDPTSELADAVTLGNSAYLSLGANVVQYTTRGITVAAGKKGGVEAASDLTLIAPVSTGSGATFEKIGTGTVTLDGDCTGASAMEVTEGTLVLGALGSFVNGLAVTVKPGATLVQNKYVGNIAVTCEEGGTYEQDIQYLVPYSDATGVSTPLDFTAAVPSLPLSIRLTEPVEIASFAANGYTAKRITVARLPSDTTATASDFNDGTAKYCGLPKTSFEIVTGDGCKELVLVARPVVWSVKDFDESDVTLNGTAAHWSNGSAAQSGYDYFVTNMVGRTGASTATTSPHFSGDSLTVAGFGASPLEFKLTTPGVDVGDAAFYGAVKTYYNNATIRGAGYTGITSGMIEIAEDAMLDAQTRRSGSGVVMTNRLGVAVSGGGTLAVSVSKQIDGGMPVYLTGDNSAFSGKMLVTGDGTAAETSGTILHLGQGASFGGAMASATADGMLLEKYSFLMPEQTMTLNAANRGITVAAGGFDVPEGVALTVAVPLTVNGPAIKRGAGELVLSGAMEFTARDAISVQEGSVCAKNDAAASADFAFADGTSIVLDPGAELTNGLFGDITASGTVTIAFDAESESYDSSMAYKISICTVPATAADLTDRFSMASLKSHTTSIAKESVTIDGVSHCRYSAVYGIAGLTIILR